MKKSFLGKVSLVTAVVFVLSSIPTQDSKAQEQENQFTLDNVLVSTSALHSFEEVELSEEVLSDDFDLEEAVENIPSVDEMSPEQRQLFDALIEEQITIYGFDNMEEDKAFAEVLTDFFDKSSGIYNDLPVAQEQLEKNIEEIQNEEEKEFVIKDTIIDAFSTQEANAFQARVSVKFAAATFNTLFGMAVGGVAGGVSQFIIKKGKKEAQRIFTKTVVSRLKAWGAPKLAVAVGAGSAWAMNYMDLGTGLAKWIDARDSKPKNDYIELK